MRLCSGCGGYPSLSANKLGELVTWKSSTSNLYTARAFDTVMRMRCRADLVDRKSVSVEQTEERSLVTYARSMVTSER